MLDLIIMCSGANTVLNTMINWIMLKMLSLFSFEVIFDLLILILCRLIIISRMCPSWQ